MAVSCTARVGFESTLSQDPSQVGRCEGNVSPFAGFTVDPGGGLPGTRFSLEADQSFDVEDPPEALAYRWDWGSDGSIDAEGVGTELVLDTVGSHLVTLRVEDSCGAVGISEVEVLVADGGATITVDSGNDVVDGNDGQTTFREAIEAANAEIGPNAIFFAGPQVIALQSALPPLTDDATSIVGGPGVVVDAAEVGAVDNCLQIESNANLIMWIEIRDCSDDAIEFVGAVRENRIAYCSIHGNADNAIDVNIGGSNNQFGPGNHLFNNVGAAVRLSSTSDLVVNNRVHNNRPGSNSPSPPPIRSPWATSSTIKPATAFS